MKKPAVVYTFVTDDFYVGAGTPVLINSFKYFHPDIPLVVFRQKTIERVFAEQRVNWVIAKPAFARMLVDEYELVVNMDADHVVTAYMKRLFEDDYDVAAPTNCNDFANTHYFNITDQMYLQGGMVASRSPRFWELYDFNNHAHWDNHGSHENNTLNMLWYNCPEVVAMKRLALDQDYGYYSCKSLNREPEFYIKDDKLWCRGEQVFCYHHAKGAPAMPKLVFDRMPFTPPVREWLKKISSGDPKGKAIEL